MTALRRLHVAMAIMAGLALAALLYGAFRLAVMLLIILVIAAVCSLEVLRDIANRENRS